MNLIRYMGVFRSYYDKIDIDIECREWSLSNTK